MIASMLVASPPSQKRPIWRQVMRSPLIWAVILLGAALPWYLAEDAVAFVPFMLTLIGGTLCGEVFVRITFRIKNPKLGVFVHLLGALSFAVLIWQLFFGSESSLVKIFEFPFGLGALMFFALIPAAAWTWRGLLKRITLTVSTRP